MQISLSNQKEVVMMNIGFNGPQVKEELNKIITENKELESVFESLKKQVTELKDYWDSATSDEVYYHFEDYKNYFQSIIDAFNGDIKFLDDTIKNYETAEYNANKEIDEKIVE